MKDISEIINILKQNRGIFSRYGLTLLGVFGSYVKGKQTPESDLDILVEIENDENITLFSLGELETTINTITGIDCDIVLNENLKPNIGKVIREELIKI